MCFILLLIGEGFLIYFFGFVCAVIIFWDYSLFSLINFIFSIFLLLINLFSETWWDIYLWFELDFISTFLTCFKLFICFYGNSYLLFNNLFEFGMVLTHAILKYLLMALKYLQFLQCFQWHHLVLYSCIWLIYKLQA